MSELLCRLLEEKIQAMRIYELIRVILGLQFRYTAYKRLQVDY